MLDVLWCEVGPSGEYVAIENSRFSRFFGKLVAVIFGYLQSCIPAETYKDALLLRGHQKLALLTTA